MKNIFDSAIGRRLKTFATISALALIVSCSNQAKQKIETVETQTQADMHLAFSGGGWRAHTVHSGLIMSLLQANNCSSHDESCLTDALTNVQTISSNSGGSWFNSMLNYNSRFTAQITAADAFSKWSTSTGIRSHFD